MSSEQNIPAKMKEIHEALAKETGVNVADVAKIINYLGLEGALKNRFAKASTPNADPRLSQINLKTIRISAGLMGGTHL